MNQDYPVFAVGGNFNPNVDALIGISGGSGKYREFLLSLPGTRLWLDLLHRFSVGYQGLSHREKVALKVKLVMAFHSESNGGWFWKPSGGSIYRFGWRDLLTGKNGISSIIYDCHRRLERSEKKDKPVDDDVDVALPEDVDLEKLKTDDGFAKSFSGGIGSMDNDTVEKIINALGGKLPHPKKSPKQQLQEWCDHHRYLREVYFQGKAALKRMAKQLSCPEEKKNPKKSKIATQSS